MSAPASPSDSPFATAGAEAIRNALVARLADAGSSPVFRGLAYGLAVVMAPVLAWSRDRAGVTLSPGQVRTSLRLDALTALVERRVVLVPGAADGAVGEVPVPDMPDELVARVRAYLDQVPGYDPDRAPTAQRPRVHEHHAYSLHCLRHAFGPGDRAGLHP